MRVAVTRPAGAGETFAAALAAEGHEAVAAPLLEIESLTTKLPDLAGYQAVLATSANAFLDCGEHSLAAASRVLAVGAATAAAARAAGAREVREAAGDAESLATLVEAACRPGDGPLLYLCGRVRRVDLAGRLRAAGFAVDQLETYEARPVADLPEVLRTRIADGELDAIAFFSPRTAGSFVRLLREAGLERACAGLTALCLSAAVAAELEHLAWRRVAVAETPTQEALLAALARHDRAEGAC